MKHRITLWLLFLLCHTYVLAQNGRIPAIDKSPMDMAYYPANYPVLKIQDKTTEPPLARVIYSRPSKNNRTVFGELVEYGTIWRLGANEATELELFRDAKIGNVKLKKGRYSLFAIPTEKSWTIIVNRDTDTWGAFKYDIKKDLVRVTVPAEKTPEMVESFSMIFEKSATGANLMIYWDNFKAGLPIQF